MTHMNRQKLNEILDILSPEGTAVDFKAFDEGVDKLKQGLKQKIQAKTLDDVNGQLLRFKRGLDFEPLFNAIKDIDKNFDGRIQNVASLLEGKLAEFEQISKSEREQNSFNTSLSKGDIEALRFELDTLKTQKDKELSDLRAALPVDTSETIAALQERIALLEVVEEEPDLISPIKQELLGEIQNTRNDLISRINNHGGNMNRNMAIGGNTSVLGRYTDMNIKAGANVTLTYSNNDTTKYLDLTIAATGGGGGSVTGIIRSINNISTSQTAGNTNGTDYVYICTAGVQVTLPAAAGNINLYTIKNISNSSVLVSGTIDNDATGVIMPVKYTSIDVISNNVDWDIT